MAVYERIEVVRGAAGLFTGVGDPSATVNLVRKRPTDTFHGSANLSAGSWDYYRIEGDISGPIAGNGRIRARLVGAYTDNRQQVRFQHDKSPALYGIVERSEEHTSELQSLMRISYAVFCLKKKYLQNIQRHLMLHNIKNIRNTYK